MATKTNDDGSVTVDLAYPIDAMGEKRSSFTLKRAKGKQVRKIDLAALTKGDVLLGIIGELAAVPPGSCDQLDASDIAALAEVVRGFFEQSRRIGEAS